MNKRNVTKHKGSKVKSNNDPSEVFVLPPNLLEALGINLGNIEIAPECTAGNQISEKDLIYKEKSAGLSTPHNISEINFNTSSEKESDLKSAGQNLICKEKFLGQDTLASIPENNITTSLENESSIIHTAKLMKASVFLSPTFISNNRGIIEGEVEILGSNKFVENAISMQQTCLNKEEYDQDYDYMIEGLKFPIQHKEAVTESNFENANDAKSSEAVQKTNKDVQLTDVHFEINKPAKDVKCDDHANEAYLSDSSNGNVEINDKSDGSNSSVLPTKNNKIISIISEQTLDPSQLKSFQSSYSSKKKCLIPVTMDTVLKSSFRNSNCYQNSINNNCDSKLVTYYVEPCVITESDLLDVNERKSECENISDLLLKNESFTESDIKNLNYASGDSLVNHINYITHNILSNVSEDVTFNSQTENGSSQPALKGHESEHTHLVLSDTLNCKEKWNIMETHISNTNTIPTNNEETELNETLQKGDSNAFDTPNFYVNRNFLSSVSENVQINKQIQEVSSQHELEVHKSIFDVPVVLADTFNYEDSDKATETNVSGIISTKTYKAKFDEEKVNATLQKVNPNSLAEQDFNIDCSRVSSEKENIEFSTRKQEPPQAFEIYEKELDSLLVLPETLDCENSGNITETNISGIISTKTYKAKFDEEKVNATLQKVNPNSLAEQDFNIDCSKVSSEKENIEFSTRKQEPQQAIEIYEKELDSLLVLPETLDCENSGNITETNISGIISTKTYKAKFDEEKVNATLQKINPNSLDEQDFNIDCSKVSSEKENIEFSTREQEPPQAFEIYEKELDSLSVLPETLDCENSGNITETNISDTKTPNTIMTNYEEQKINLITEKINSSAVDEENFYVDDKHLKLKAVSDKVNTKVTTIKENCKKTSRDMKRKSGIFLVKDSKINSISKDHLFQTNVNKKKLNDEIKSIQVKKKILKRFRKKKCNIEIRDVLVQEKTELTKKSSKEIFDSCIVPDDNTEMIQYNNKSLSTSTADHSIHLGSLVINNEIEEDKIREIAGYLKKFAELQKRKKIFKEKQNISDIKIFSNKKHATNTKLSIQGVEKPGGLEKGKDRKCDKTIKTYERKRKYKSPVNVEWNTVSFEMLTQKIDLSTNTSFDTYKDTEFCLCEDFGRFIYYDEETMYEHIHFWNREHVDCTPDLVFSIYNENIPTEISDTNKLQNCSSIPIQSFCELDHEEKGNEHIVTSICERIENVSLNVDKPESSVDEQMKPDASKSSGSQAQNTENLHNKAMESLSLLENCQETLKNNIVSDMNSKKNEKKRKYSSTFNESDEPPLNQYVTESKLEAHVKSYKVVKKQKCSENEHTEKIVPGDHTDSEGNFAIPLNKDTATVCGVCQQHIKNIDWLKHIASQHNYLSWRADEEPLDFKNRQLLVHHLATLIKQYGVLSCNKCGITRKYAKPFLQHINQCATVEEYQRESVLPSSEFDSKSRPFNHSNSSIQHACVEEQPEPLRLVECGVCRQSIQDKDWNSHIESHHNYLAWKNGENTLDVDDDDDVKEHLNKILKERGGLKCAKCGLIRKYVKSYQTHIKSCDGENVSESLNEGSKGFLHIVSDMETVRYVSDPGNNISIDNGAELVTDDLLKCGVCGEFMRSKAWNSHIGSQHNYLAWRHGESALDVADEVAVKEHLYNIMKECGGLKCAKCGLIRKYVKSYQTHIRDCDGLSESIRGCATNSSLDVSEMESVQHVNDLISDISIGNEAGTSTDVIRCAVCGYSMRHSNWYDHIGFQHNYLAWRCGDPTLDFEDEEAVHKHLYAITKEYGGLKCVKCGLNRKYVKAYLTHVKSCTGHNDSQTDFTVNEPLNISEVEPSNIISELTFENEKNGVLIRCGVCEQIVQNNNWYNHIESKHKYLAWKYGEPALDVDNEEAVREHLNNITKEYGSLNCTKCGITRKYVKSYLTHVKSCSGRSTQDGNPIADDAEPNIVVLSEAEQHTGLTKCGVCGQYMPLTDWAAHIEGKHDYLAWKDGEPPLNIDDEVELQDHLFNIVKEIGTLVCVKCGARRRFPKSYLQHIKKCYASEEAENSSKVTDQVIIWPDAGADQVKCGVCDELVQVAEWIKHIATQHDYLAKKVGETPLDVNDDEEVYVHLYNIVKENGSLACQKCGIKRKYVKSYLEHIRKCGQDESVIGDSTFETNTTLDTSDCLVDFYRGGTCGVCDKEVETGKWIQHIQKEHNYLAWRKGEKPWDLDDCTQVNEYLYEISKKMGGLTCNKCGLVRKYVKSYLTHIKSCNVVDFNLASIVPDGVGPVSDKAYRCAMCQKEIEPSNWKNHAMKEHYNITWIIGETPIDIKNPYAVEKYLKEYKQSNSLKCNNCGATRTSFAGFYAHIITCGKSEEQIEMFQSVCDICNNKYLCIYKNQHMMIHRVQSYNKELKMSKEKVKLVESGKRRAAQKARTVIETYNSDMSQHSHKCSTCGFGTDFKEELKSHRCDRNEKDFSEEESSVAEGEGSEDESADSEVDSDISREEEDQLQTLRKRCKEPVSVGSKLSKINFKVDDPNEFIEQSDIDFCNAFFTDETLFPKWISCKREIVSIKDLPKYLPPMEESCKVNAGLDWTTLKRFEAKSGDGTSIFVGASIVCVTWIPLRVEDIMGDGQNFLAIACHNDVDCPRYECDETVQHENLIQIWDFGTRDELPQIVYGIAHDFGTVWSMDWCPSGARDVLPEDLTDGRPFRLGLLAVACSNGSAYIFSVPHPSTVIENNRFIQKLKPVAELRMKMLVERSERKVYQATSVTWSKEKGHEVILVGYADGSTGYYDINNESPLSWRVEDEVDIFFPYSEERPHNTCVTATDIVPRLDGGFVSCSASPTGAEMSIPGAGVRVRSHLPARAAIFAPHWPATLLAGDIAIMSTAVNELEWTQPARKLGGIRALAGCARCGRVAAAAPPTLRVMRPHPAYPEFKKPIFGMIEMVPLANKRSKQVNDELAMKIEPLTYPETIIKYGIQFQSVNKCDKVLQQKYASKPKAHFPERFPLADVESMAFCPAKRYHDRLAVATHSGIVFITNVNL
ncbi:uncharacterized protein isoform X2 [Choristoneura fumiferana]